MTTHSKVGFSARKRWKNCAGSVRLSEGIASRSSSFAEEGTAAHALQEHCLRTADEPRAWIGRPFDYDDHGVKKTIVVPKDMAEHIQGVVDRIRGELAADPDAVLLVEEKFHLSSIHPDLFGTGDVAIWFPKRRRLQCRDLKYGAGIAVEVEEGGIANEQIEGYGLGALLKHPEWNPVDVELVVDQPRAFHEDGPTRSVVLPLVHFVDLAADLLDEVRATEDPNAPLNDGEWCRFCPAAGICPKLASRAQEAAKIVFAPGLPYDAGQLAETLEWLPILEAWIKNVREFAYAEAEKGHVVPRHKLVEKRATRKWRDEQAAAESLTRVVPADEASTLWEPQCLKSPAAIEKLLPKDQRSVLDELCIKESSGHTLVHESDKRDAVKIDAKSAFAGA
ncbi:hypothetical protein BLA39750_02199 [Burkholderia lata]|uniref:DUF2800 domain-containing protein n=1 Tax=Burkholderia lata (strain ATCC 17760 / DSM 23089 / LMG 22485 / NCIMB 9086 / R18194 / 383) TaxID=482957 RepID=A0A6P2WKU9_BURL3|nr:DUF2800 domain-containing protein [Burkholderia lata]VWC95593.1 hypothetical protein BLA39750_02199 [Burkholderia lata]